LAASVFHFGKFSINEVKQALAQAGLPVRLPRFRAGALDYGQGNQNQ